MSRASPRPFICIPPVPAIVAKSTILMPSDRFRKTSPQTAPPPPASRTAQIPLPQRARAPGEFAKLHPLHRGRHLLRTDEVHKRPAAPFIRDTTAHVRRANAANVPDLEKSFSLLCVRKNPARDKTADTCGAPSTPCRTTASAGSVRASSASVSGGNFSSDGPITCSRPSTPARAIPPAPPRNAAP